MKLIPFAYVFVNSSHSVCGESIFIVYARRGIIVLINTWHVNLDQFLELPHSRKKFLNRLVSVIFGNNNFKPIFR